MVRWVGVAYALSLPLVVSAAGLDCASTGADSTICDLRALLVKNILNPLLALILAASVVVFIYGVFEYLQKLRKGENASDGQEHMKWGLIGLFVASCAMAIMTIIVNTVNALFPH